MDVISLHAITQGWETGFIKAHKRPVVLFLIFKERLSYRAQHFPLPPVLYSLRNVLKMSKSTKEGG